MKLDEGMDTGPTFARVTTPVGPDETAGELGVRLAQLGADAVTAWLPRFVRGECALVPQDDATATLAPMLAKDHGRIDWSLGSKAVHDHVRGMSPWPGAFTTARGHTLKVGATHPVGGSRAGTQPGEVVVADKARVLVACGAGDLVELLMVQPEGRRAVRATDWVMGRGIAEGDRLG
jgi:methionyl-tRNA formyltransferase